MTNDEIEELAKEEARKCVVVEDDSLLLVLSASGGIHYLLEEEDPQTEAQKIRRYLFELLSKFGLEVAGRVKGDEAETEHANARVQHAVLAALSNHREKTLWSLFEQARQRRERSACLRVQAEAVEEVAQWLKEEKP